METLRKIGRFVSANALLCFIVGIVVLASAGGIYAGLKLKGKDDRIEQLQHDVELLRPKCPCDTLVP